MSPEEVQARDERGIMGAMLVMGQLAFDAVSDPELGVSVRHEGQDSTCREAGAILLSLMSTVVVSDCASLYLSTRAIFILMGQPLFGAVSGPGS